MSYKHKKCGGEMSSPLITCALSGRGWNEDGEIDIYSIASITYFTECEKCGKSFSIGESGDYAHIYEIAERGV